MDDPSQVNTGDVLLFSGNNPTSIVIKFLTSSIWNHAGIGVRLNKEGKPSFNVKDELYVFDINSASRFDPILQKEIEGASLCTYNWLKGMYNFVAVRHLDNKYRTAKMLEKMRLFLRDHYQTHFASGYQSAFKIGMAFPILGATREMFCTELVTKFYVDYLFPIVESSFENRKLKEGKTLIARCKLLFGSEAPKSYRHFIPENFTFSKTPESSIFPEKEKIIFKDYSNALTVLGQPFFIVILFAIILLMLLPQIK